MSSHAAIHSRLHGIARSLIAVTLLVGLAACDDDPTGPGSEISIGGLFSLTGNWSTLGRTSRAAMEIAVEDVNAYLAVDGASLRFAAAIEDTKLDPALALQRAAALRGQGVRRCRAGDHATRRSTSRRSVEVSTT